MPGDPILLESFWPARLQAVGKMQARYLWFLVVSGIFYGALASGALRPSENGDAVKVPVLNLELDSAAILTTGPLVLSFLVLVITGALRAYRHASEQLKIDKWDDRGEATDTEPNFLDMAFYSRGPKRGAENTTGRGALKKHLATVKRLALHYVHKLVAFKYPVFLSLALVEAAWLWWFVESSLAPFSSFASVVNIVSVFLWLIACAQVLWYWSRRVADLIWV